MNSRQRVQLALAHKEADRIPFDLGGTVLTSIHVNAYRNLRRYLGITNPRENVAQSMPYAGLRAPLQQFMKREGTGWDTGHLVRFLLSDQSKFMTGQSICLDGGASLVGPSR